MIREIYFEVDICGSPVTGIAEAEHGKLIAITFEDGSRVEPTCHSQVTPYRYGAPVAEAFYAIVAPEVLRCYVDEIEASLPDAPRHNEHALGRHQLI